jgi:transcription elongation factor Elf1
MLSLSQIQAGAYWASDCTIVCVKCGDKMKLPVSAQIIRYNLDSEWPDGLWCDECGAVIVEPEEETEFEDQDPEQDLEE